MTRELELDLLGAQLPRRRLTGRHRTLDACPMQKWEYLVVPLEEAGAVKKKSEGVASDRLNALGAQGWEAVGLTLKRGDLVAWPVVLLKRPVD